uniref:Glycosyltransferase family 2 protein n=1 Tax=Desulfatirhabdium butyrativorans TaxID=340467 RepID=A0A7C4RT37_9BACT
MEPPMPLVSVIIPTYNRSAFLRNAIQSVLKQTFRNFEILVVDDASQVNVEQIIDELGDCRIRLFRHDRNRGEAAARNTGVLYAKGEYLAFLDDDDEWLAEKLEKQVSVLSNEPPSVGGVYTGFFVVDITDETLLYTKIPSISGTIYRELLRHNAIGTPSTLMIRRACIDRVGLFDGSIVYGVDHDLYLRIARYFTFACIPEPLVRYHVHDARMSNDPDVVLRGMKALTQKYGRERGGLVNRKVLGCGYYDAGIACIDRNQRKRAQALFLRSILMNPLEWLSYHQFVCSLFEERQIQALKRLKRRLFPLKTEYDPNGVRRLPIGNMK